MTRESDPTKLTSADTPNARTANNTRRHPTPNRHSGPITETYSDSPPRQPPLIYVMGVSGCGKSTVARLLAHHLSMSFCEADELHPPNNIKKMSQGIPLTDDDRLPWLGEVKTKAMALAATHPDTQGCVIACSALKKIYRDILGSGDRDTWFVYLKGDYDTIHQRMSARTGHFMPDALLQSQFDTLEAPDSERNVVVIDVNQSAENIATEAAEQLVPRLSL